MGSSACFSSPFNVFTQTQLWAESQNSQPSFCFRSWPSVDSTNERAKKEKLPAHSSLGLYLAQHQTQGRGRSQNIWVDQNNSQVFLGSWLIRLPFLPQALSGPRLGLSLYRSVRSIWPHSPFSLKAPNDLFLGTKKVAGILMECLNEESQYLLIVGLGLNVFSCPSSLPEAGFLAQDKKIKSSLTPELWFQFLSLLKNEWHQSALMCHHSELNTQEQANLTQALQLHPKQGYSIRQVSSQGDLVTRDGIIPWFQL